MDEEADDKAKRIKSLEEMWKLQQIDRETFEKLRDEIIGGDINSVHLMKGLDFKLLERARRGEDLLSKAVPSHDEQEQEEDEADVDDEFEELESKEVKAVEKEKKEKHGEMAKLIPGRKRNRDQILAEMKAAREAAKAKAGPSLGSKFRKIGAPKNEPQIEKDSKGREVLITVDEHGNEKRKVRKVQVEETPKGHGLEMPEADAPILGADVVVPEAPKPPPEEDDDTDIFDDVGDDYDPFAGLADEDSGSDKEGEEEDGEVPHERSLADKKAAADTASMPPPPPKPTVSKPRNYFGTSTEPEPETARKPAAMSDPNILAAFKKASMLAKHEQDEKSKEEKEREAKLKRMLQSQDRDAADLDMGFGNSRNEDEEDFGDDSRIKLSEWDRDDDDNEEGGGKSGGKRKRGTKKRKGDKDSAADVLRVMEQRKSGKS